MFRTERQRQLSHFVAELRNLVSEKCYNYPDLTDAEIEYVYAALASYLMNEVSKWAYEDLREGE
jgi:hypothetical protein